MEEERCLVCAPLVMFDLRGASEGLSPYFFVKESPVFAATTTGACDHDEPRCDRTMSDDQDFRTVFTINGKANHQVSPTAANVHSGVDMALGEQIAHAKPLVSFSTSPTSNKMLTIRFQISKVMIRGSVWWLRAVDAFLILSRKPGTGLNPN